MESGGYSSKHDLEQLFKELVEVLTEQKPARPLQAAIQALDTLQLQRDSGSMEMEKNHSYKNVFRSALSKATPQPTRAFHRQTTEHSAEEDFASFDWKTTSTNSNSNSNNNNNNNSGSKEEEEDFFPKRNWSPSAMNAAAATVSAGPVRPLPGFNAGRRFSISAEPYTPSECSNPRVVIPKDEATRQRIHSAVKDNLLFRNLDRTQLEQIIDAMFERRVQAGMEIIRQGEEGDYFYAIDSGRAQVIKDGQMVVELGPGEAFGELALMYGSPRLATVKALEPTILWAVDRATFRGIVIDLAFQKRRMYESFLRSVPLLHTLHDGELYRICDALQPAYYQPNEAIVTQGDNGHDFYIIEEGTAVATMHQDNTEEVEVAKIGVGDYFGELALLRDAPRAATVRALTPVKCVILTKADFIRLLGPVMPILQRNQEHYRKYEEYLNPVKI